jgi:hypothetical protein
MGYEITHPIVLAKSTQPLAFTVELALTSGLLALPVAIAIAEMSTTPVAHKQPVTKGEESLGQSNIAAISVLGLPTDRVVPRPRHCFFTSDEDACSDFCWLRFC